ncbi:DNA polymerase III subunit alpha [Streptomyces tanashiensis]
MYAIDSSDAWQQGCRNTRLVAEQIDTTGMFEPRDLMPKFDIPEGYTEHDLVPRGDHARHAPPLRPGIPDDRMKQVEYEMDTIISMGFPGYFLVVADFIMLGEEAGHRRRPRPRLRGRLDRRVRHRHHRPRPDPARTDLPALPQPRARTRCPTSTSTSTSVGRVEVIRYATEKYGADKVAMIGTYGKIKAKNAIKDSARVLGYPYAMGDRLTKAMPADVLGKGIAASTASPTPRTARYSEAGEIRAIYENEPDVKKVIDTARGVEGLVRQMGVHAAGVIMSSEPIVEARPIWVGTPTASPSRSGTTPSASRSA